MTAIKLAAALVICGVALVLPYRPRVAYGLLLARLVHAPYLAFGRLARRLLRELGYHASAVSHGR